MRPMEVSRHVVVDGGALAAHFAYGSQRTAGGGRGRGGLTCLGGMRIMRRRWFVLFRGGTTA